MATAAAHDRPSQHYTGRMAARRRIQRVLSLCALLAACGQRQTRGVLDSEVHAQAPALPADGGGSGSGSGGPADARAESSPVTAGDSALPAPSAGRGGQGGAAAAPDSAMLRDASPSASSMPDAAADDAGAPAGCSDCCPDGFARGTPAAASILRRLAAFTPSPADVATCPDGSVFVTLDGPDQVWRIPESGPPVVYADVSGVQPAGIACDARGRLFVIAFALRATSPFKTPGVLLLEGEHAAPRLLPQPRGASLATPNGIAAASGIGLYATDTLGGVVVLIREVNGTFESTVAARNLLGVNGVAYDGAARKLYVSNSVTQEVTSFAVSADGALSKPSVEWTATGFEQLDGMVVDELGRAYVAGWGKGDVHRLSDPKVVATVAKPASLAFRGGTLLVVDYRLGEPTQEGGLYAVDLGACAAR